MIPFKSHESGQTFIEIMLTVFMMSVLLIPLLNLQSLIIKFTSFSISHMRRITLLKDIYFHTILDHLQQKEPLTTKQITSPPTTITLKQLLPAKESALSSFENIVIDKYEALWQQGNEDNIENIVIVRFEPQKKES